MLRHARPFHAAFSILLCNNMYNKGCLDLPCELLYDHTEFSLVRDTVEAMRPASEASAFEGKTDFPLI